MRAGFVTATIGIKMKNGERFVSTRITAIASLTLAQSERRGLPLTSNPQPQCVLRVLMLSVMTMLLSLELLAQTPQPTEDSSVRPILLVVHGRNEGKTDSVVLRNRWFAAIDSGLLAAGLSPQLIPNSDRRFVYYGNVFLSTEPHPRCGDVRVTSKSSITADEDASPRNGALRVVRGLTKFIPSALNYRMIMHFTKDTKEYIEEGLPSCNVRNILIDHFDTLAKQKRPIVVLAHSQGALLTHEYAANTSGWGVQLSGLVSVGSQFGFDGLITRLGAKKRRGSTHYSTPPGLGGVWYNLYDDHDAVAFRMAGRFDSTDATPTLREIRMRNNAPFRHDATGYFVNPVVGLATADAWCRAAWAGTVGCSAVSDSIKAGRLVDSPRRAPDGWSLLAAPLSLVPIAIAGWLGGRVIKRW
jgi:hypothetical protein